MLPLLAFSPDVTSSTSSWVLLNQVGFAAACVLIVATVTDIRHRKIYNWLTYPAMFLGLLLATGASLNLRFGQLQLQESILGLLGCGLFMLVPYTLSGGGAGDVKLAMAMGSLIGFEATLQSFCIGYIGAAIYVTLRCARVTLLEPSVSWSPTFIIAYLNRPGSSAMEPIPLAGFFATGMACLVILGPLW